MTTHTTITKFEKKMLLPLGQEAAAALQDLAKKYGLKIEYNGGTYSPNEFKLKILLRTAEGAKPFAKERESYISIAHLYDMDAAIDTIYNYGQEKYRLAGLQTSRRGSPKIVAEKISTGKFFAHPLDAVKAIVMASAKS